MKRTALCLTIFCFLLSVPMSAARIPLGFIDFINPYAGLSDRPGGAQAEYTFRVYWFTGPYGFVKTDVQLSGATLTVHFNEGPDLVSNDPTQPWRFPLDLNGNPKPGGTLSSNGSNPHMSDALPTTYVSTDPQTAGVQSRTPVGVTLSGTFNNPGPWIYQPGALAMSFVPASLSYAFRIDLPNGWSNSFSNRFTVDEAVPEPASLFLAAMALSAVFAARKLRRV